MEAAPEAGARPDGGAGADGREPGGVADGGRPEGRAGKAGRAPGVAGAEREAAADQAGRKPGVAAVSPGTSVLGETREEGAARSEAAPREPGAAQVGREPGAAGGAAPTESAAGRITEAPGAPGAPGDARREPSAAMPESTAPGQIAAVTPETALPEETREPEASAQAGVPVAPAPFAEAPAGAPRPDLAELKEFQPIEPLQDVFFDFDRYDVRPLDARILDADATWLRTNSDYLVLIEGHCDERGTNEYNIALADHRARAVRNYLVANGIAASRIITFSYGEERPFCVERTEACWSHNRRAHFLVKRVATTR
jgi:peptidoglycan-associated lipoprotein